MIELLDFLKFEKVHVCGLSLGGLVAQWLGIHVPQRIHKLILSNTSPYLGPSKPWNDLINSLQEGAMGRFADMFTTNWFSVNTRQLPELIAKFRGMVLATKPQGLAGAFAAVRDADMRRTISLIGNPTLVIAGKYDEVTIAAHSEIIAQSIQGSQLMILPVVHMTNIELPDAFLQLTIDFLSSQ